MRGAWRARNFRDGLVARARLARAGRRIRAFPSVRRRRAHRLGRELIVSLTSYPPRFGTLALTLRSLLDQTVTPDRTILWVTPDDRKLLPADIDSLVAHGLEIRLCEDWRSYKKLVPALMHFPEAIIVTADDDLYFRPSWLEGLLKESTVSPRSVITHRAHLAALQANGEFGPYASWELDTKETGDRSSSALLFPTGGAGTLYPAGAFDPRVTDFELFERLCPSADDIWFFWMARLAGTEQRRTKAHASLLWWEGSQDVGLFHENLWGDGNDAQMRAMEAHFGKLPCRAGAPADPRNSDFAP